jgi:hypothetical protein
MGIGNSAGTIGLANYNANGGMPNLSNFGVRYLRSIPATPTNPNAATILQDRITWTWSDASNNETGFKIYADAFGGPPTTLRTTVAANSTSWTFNGRTRNTLHSFQVAATNASGDSARTTNITRWTLAGTPLAPVLGSPTGSTIDVSINASDGNPAYTVYALLETTSGLYLQANGTRGAGAVFQTRASWGTTTATGLSEATLYGFRAVARNGANVLTSPGATDSLSTLDVTPPTVVSITPATNGPTNADSVDFTVDFSEAVQNFDDAADLVITHSGTAHGDITINGGPLAYTVTIGQLSGDGSFDLSVNTASDVADLGGNALASSVTSDAVLIDNTPPGNVISAPSSPLTAGDPVSFTINYSGADTVSLAEGDLALDATDSAAATLAVTGTGNAERTVTLSDITGDGTLALSIVNTGTAADVAGNLAPTAGPSAAVTVDTTLPGFAGLAADPGLAGAGTEVQITFAATEALLSPPEVTANGNPAGQVMKSGQAWAFTYTIDEADPLGPAEITISGFDLAGNLGILTDTNALTIIANAPPVPLTGAGTLAVLLALTGALAYRRRR